MTAPLQPQENPASSERLITGEPPATNPKHHFDLNGLYHEWNTAEPSNERQFMELLLEGVKDYAKYTIWKNFSNLQADIDDAVQTVLIKVSQKIESFVGTSKFTTWVYEIIRSTALDFYRAGRRRGKIVFNDGGLNETTTPSKSRKTTSLDVQPDVAGDDDSACRDYITKQQKDLTENTLNSEIDLESAVRRLNTDDRRLVNLVRQGYNGKELGKFFNCSAKKIYNRYNRIIKILECDVVAFSVLVHTCRPDVESTYTLQPNIRGISDGRKTPSYQALPNKCHCRKEVTRREALKMVECGSAESVFRLKNNKATIDEKLIWARRAVRVPRVAASNISPEKAANGDVQLRSIRDMAAEMDDQFLRRLIVPFRQDPQEGKAILVSWADQRTPHSHGRAKFEPNPTENKPTEYFPIEVPDGGLACPRCKNGGLLVSVEPVSGAVRHECDNFGNRFLCCYLAIWRINLRLEAVNSVLSIEEPNSFDVCETSSD